MIKQLLIASLFLCPLFLHAEEKEDSEDAPGFLTSYLNRGIASAMDKAETPASEKMTYGRTVKDYVSSPQFGGYIVGKYQYTDRTTADVNNDFQVRLVRAYVSGFILRDFKYRIQVELRNTPAMRDYTLEWLRFKEFQVKVGQFKRCFSFENPMNPWDIGFGGFSQLAMRMCAFGAEAPCGEASQNGRDPGIQFSGDILPVGQDKHRLFRYQAAIYNGNGQNKTDNNNRKDLIGNVQVQPIKDLYIALFGWKGNYTNAAKTATANRSRWALGATYEHEGWSARAEYAHHTGHNVNDWDSNLQCWKDGSSNRADAWYATVGVPCTPWLKTYVKYDVYRNRANWGSARSILSVCPNFQLHKNLMFQLQYNHVIDKTSTDRHYNEFWAESYVRF